MNGAIRLAASLRIDPGTGSGVAATLANVIYDLSSAGAVEKIGVGTLTLTGAVTDSAAPAFDLSDAVPFAGVISGTGSLTQSGAGTLSLTATSTYAGDTTIKAGCW